MRAVARRSAILAALTVLAVCSLSRAQEPAWYPPSEPSPFIPDDARYLGAGISKLTHYRGQWELSGPVRRAVLVTAPRMTVDLYLNGVLVAQGHSSHVGDPQWVQVTELLTAGTVRLVARVHSDWRPLLYVQMRVEYEDGTWEDFTTDASWEWCDEPGDRWQSGTNQQGKWQPVEDCGGYEGEGNGLWGYRFALLPRDTLKEHFGVHNKALEDAWETDRAAVLASPGEHEADRWSAQFRDFCRIDPATGQLRDGSGQVRHLFFTIYGQSAGLSPPNWDLDQLERDLELMEQSGVHLYVRMLGWSWLLDEQGRWASLERQPDGAGDRVFQRGIDLLDHFVRRARAHGRYIMFEGDFHWSAHALVPPPYRSRYHLYPELLEAQALATRKIMARYARCTSVMGIMIGEEDINLAHDLENPHQHHLFTDYLRRKYGTLDEFKRQTPWGYDYSDPSQYAPGKWRAAHWPGAPEADVLLPAFKPGPDPFASAQSWEDIPLPLWPWQLGIDSPHPKMGACESHNQFTPEDPLWIDFYEMREDELLFDMLTNWATIVRQGMPDQLLMYSNAQDLTASWHFLHLFRRADLPFDVIGVGCHDSNTDLADVAPWATVRKAIKVVPAYRPYALAPGSPAVGIASGEGEGGNSDRPGEILNYYRGALFDEIGGGVAWTMTYNWRHMSGAHQRHAPHRTPLLEWMGEFMPATDGVGFSLSRPVQVLVVRNTNLAHSNMSGLDYANVRAVADFLSQLNVEFDIVMDRDLVHAPSGDCPPFKIDLTPYRLVIVPSVAIDFPDDVWAVLDDWLRSEPAEGSRVLALGWIGKRGPRLAPRDHFHPTVSRWLGCRDYAGSVELRGRQKVVLEDGGAPRELWVDFGRVLPTGVFTRGAPVLRDPEGRTIGASLECGPGQVVAFGFPLGMAHEPLWGLEPTQDPRDAMAPLFESLARRAGVSRPVLAPHNLRVYVADEGKMILIRERMGRATDEEVAIRLPARASYPDLSITRGADGYCRFRVELEPWGGQWYKAR